MRHRWISIARGCGNPYTTHSRVNHEQGSFDAVGRMDSSRPVGAVVGDSNLAVCPRVAFGSASSPPTLLYRKRLGHGHWLWGAWVFFQVIAIRANEYHRPDRIRKPHSKDVKRWLPKKLRLPQKCLVCSGGHHQGVADRPRRLCQNRWQKTP